MVDEGNGGAVDGAVVCIYEVADLSSGLCEGTGSGGGFSFAGIPTGDYRLAVTPPGGSLYLPVGVSLDGGYTPFPPVDLTLTATPLDVDVPLLLGGALEITVNAPDDSTPAVGEPVALCRTDAPGEPGSCPQIIALAGTDIDGQVTTTTLVPGEYDVWAGFANSPYGYPTETKSVIVEPGLVKGESLRMIAGGSLDGFVRDGNGVGIQGATVSLNSASGFGTQYATTNATGYYAFASLRPDTYNGTVTPPPGGLYGSTATGSITVAEFADLDADFVLPPPTVITGTASPGPISGANGAAVLVCGGVVTPVLTYPPSCSDLSPFGLVLVAPGATVPFTFTPPAAGTYTIRAAYYDGTTPLGASPSVTATLAAGETETCTLVAGTPGSASCGGPPPPAPGTVVLTVDEPPVTAPLAGYYPGFCLAPGVPVLLSTFCSDGRPAVIEFGVQGGASRTLSLAPGTYNAAMGNPQLSGISPIGTVTVISGVTTFCRFTLAAVPDCSVDDGDGIDEPPAGLPDDYDGNDDGIADAEQVNVSTLLPAVGTDPVTIAAPTGATITGVSAGPVPASPAPPPGATFPVGLLGFSVELASGQTAADVEIHLPAGTNPSGYQKLQGGAWIDFGAHATIVGDVVTLHLVDGGAGDADGVVNGVIVDPGAPVGVRFTAFLSPIAEEGHTAKAGSTVPVKWRFLDQSGAPVSDPASVVGLTVVPCGSNGSPTAVVAAGRSGLQYAGDGYWQVNWKTTKRDAGTCATLTLTLVEGFTQSVDVTLR